MNYMNYKLPRAFTDDSDLGMCYENKVILHEDIFLKGNIFDQSRLIERLLYCMKETNEKTKHEFPFYQIRVRPTIRDEVPLGICFELRWGNREMLQTNDPLSEPQEEKDGS